MLAVLSGQYINPELRLHYGALPPSFLPIGSQRFFARQIALAQSEAVLMTLPQGYCLQESDRKLLERLGVRLLFLPATISLNEAVLEVAGRASAGESLRILFGDTFVDVGPEDMTDDDIVVVQDTPLDYPWTYSEEGPDGLRFTDHPSGTDNQHVVCGYFKFSDLAALGNAFRQDSFAKALTAYGDCRSVSLVEAREWYDFGHLAMYYKSRRSLLVARMSNSLDSDGYSIRKRSHDAGKMDAEAHWFENLPNRLKLHAPRFLGRFNEGSQAGYEIEYLHFPTLGDLLVFGNHTAHSWRMILNRCFEFLEKCQAVRPDVNAPELSEGYAGRFFENVIVRKTWSRLHAFCENRGISIDRGISVNGCEPFSLRVIAEDIIASLPRTRPEHIAFWHGDFFFGNIFFDFSTHRVVTIDPRGHVDTGSPALFGDWRYDLGKMAHSVLGGYDVILAGRSSLQKHSATDWTFRIAFNDTQDAFSGHFIESASSRFGIEAAELHAWAALMFLSMLPLHADSLERQEQLLANGIRLHALLKSSK